MLVVVVAVLVVLLVVRMLRRRQKKNLHTVNGEERVLDNPVYAGTISQKHLYLSVSTCTLDCGILNLSPSFPAFSVVIALRVCNYYIWVSYCLLGNKMCAWVYV